GNSQFQPSVGHSERPHRLRNPLRQRGSIGLPFRFIHRIPSSMPNGSSHCQQKTQPDAAGDGPPVLITGCWF
ncbi:MAG: hypothetical protein ACK4VP_06975, partial [Nitrospira sp.]